MKILLVDIGTGTQDIFLYDSRLELENGYKLILPSPTMMVYGRIKAATQARTPVLLMGRQMGGGPSAWAAEAHARAGLPVYATPEAALTLDDERAKVEALGIQILSENEANRLPLTVTRILFQDFDFQTIASAFSGFDVSLTDLSAVAVGVFDHGAAPPGVSDRQFRFNYLDDRIRQRNSLSAFAYLSEGIPPFLSRLQAVAGSAAGLDCPLIVMDTAPAAILGATFDPLVEKRAHKIITNIGNFHTLAFRLGAQGIEGVFEHHTGEIDFRKLEGLLFSLADGTLKHEDVFNDMGHGALIYNPQPFALGMDDFDVVVTGPRRCMLNEKSPRPGRSLRAYFASPFGDMMLTGCFGLLAATAELLPEFNERIKTSMNLSGRYGTSVAPWDVD